MAKKKKTKKLRTIACKHLEQLNEISNIGYPLCFCKKRDFNLAPFNYVCQVCELYSENPAELTHEDMYVADNAKDFIYDPDTLEFDDDSDDDFDEEADEFDEDEDEDEEEDEEEAPVKKKKKKAKVVIEEEEEPEEEDEDEEEEEEEEIEIDDEIEGPIIGVDNEEEEEEEDLEIEDEVEEALGKKRFSEEEEEEFDEEDELEEELEFEEDLVEEEMDDDGDLDDGDMDDGDMGDGPSGSVSAAAADIDFEADVINKIKKIGDKEICPFCQKSKASVLRHLSKCKRCPPEYIAALKDYRKKKK